MRFLLGLAIVVGFIAFLIAANWLVVVISGHPA